jgi:hypothetical protein
MSFWFRSPLSGDSGGGGVSFNESIQILNADNTISIRQMNFDGGFYDVENYVDEDDTASLSLGFDNDGEGRAFIDAVQDLLDEEQEPIENGGLESVRNDGR